MKPSELKNISKLMEKRNRIAEDLPMFLATSQVVVLHMRHPKTFETNYDAELWKDQCNKLLDDIAMKTREMKEYLNNDTGGESSKSNRPRMSLKLISRHYTDDDMDHLNPGCLNNTNTKDSTLKKSNSNSSDNEQMEKERNSDLDNSKMNGAIAEECITKISNNVAKVDEHPIALESKVLSHNDDELLEELLKISDISDNDLQFSDITLGSESDEKPEYTSNSKRKKLVKKKYPVQEADFKLFNRACFVKLKCFDVNLYKEYVAKHSTYKLSDLTEFLKLTNKRKRVSSSSSSDGDRSLGNSSPVYYPQSEEPDALQMITDKSSYDPLLTAYDQRHLNPEEEMIAAMNQISDSDLSGLDSDLDSDSDSANKTTKEKVKKTKKKRRKLASEDLDSDFEPENVRKSSSAWKRDPLLRENIDSDEKNNDKNKSDIPKKEEDGESDGGKLPIHDDAPVISDKTDSDFVPIEDSTDSVDSDVECLGDVTVSPGKGRKNIRAMLHDEALNAATQRANKIEQEKQKRLEELKNSLSSFALSQSSNGEIDGLLLDVDQSTMKPLVVVNDKLTTRLKDHQQEGVKFMWNACFERLDRISKTEGNGCILAHCMGLGKTFQVATLVHTLFAYPATKVKYVLIICPLSTVPNWNQEFVLTKRVAQCGSFKVFFKSRTTVNARSVVLTWQKQGGVLILGYDMFHSLLNRKKTITSKSASNATTIEQALRNPGPDLVVCDEGHLLKNQNKRKYKTVNQIKTRRRIILTGTPMQNNLTEYYYMVQLIKPSLLGTFKEFTNRFNNPIVNGQYGDSTNADIKIMKQRSHVLHKILKGTVQRYEESELNIYLPKKIDYALYIQMNEVQASLYRDVLQKLRFNHEPGKKLRDFISHYQKLMPFWMHPCISFAKENNKDKKKRVEYETISLDNLDEDVIDLTPDLEEKFPEDVETNIEYGAKFVIIMAIIEECLKLGDRLLIFSTSLFTLDTIEKFLVANNQAEFQWVKNRTYLRLDGQVPPVDRVDITDKFNDKNSNAKLMLMTNKVGGLGLNLVAANRVILADISWNPALDTQSIFRSYRFGQEKPVFIYRLVARGTMEETVYRRAVTKVAIAGRVVDEQQIDRHYRSVDLQEIYRFHYDKEEVRPIPKVPADDLLATLLQSFPASVFGYDEHNSLFLNRPDEELNEEEMKEAWVDYNKEKAPKPAAQITVLTPTTLATDPLYRYRYLDDFLPPLLSSIPADYFVAMAKTNALLKDINSTTSILTKQPTTATVSQSSMAVITKMSPFAATPRLSAPNPSTKDAEKDVWLSKSLMPRLPANLIQNHRSDKVTIKSQNVVNNNSVARKSIINLTPNTLHEVVRSMFNSQNNMNNITNENSSIMANVTDGIDLTLSADKVTPVDTNQILHPVIAVASNQLLDSLIEVDKNQPIAASTVIIIDDVGKPNNATRQSTDVTADITSAVEPEDFVVNPFLPTENAENNPTSDGEDQNEEKIDSS